MFPLSFAVSVYFSENVSTVDEKKAGTSTDFFMKDLFPRHICAGFSPKPLKIGSIFIKYQHPQQ